MLRLYMKLLNIRRLVLTEQEDTLEPVLCMCQCVVVTTVSVNHRVQHKERKSQISHMRKMKPTLCQLARRTFLKQAALRESSGANAHRLPAVRQNVGHVT